MTGDYPFSEHGNLQLCACSVLTGGTRSVNAACPIHGKPDPSVPLSAIRALVQQWRKHVELCEQKIETYRDWERNKALAAIWNEQRYSFTVCADQLAALRPVPLEMLQCQTCGHVWGAYEDTCHCNSGRCHNEPACLRKLRDITGCGLLDCSDALERTRWDLAKAEEHLRKKGTPNGHNEPCLVPPAGWSCSRRAGHDGPCAARPASWLEPDLNNAYITREQADEYMRQHHHRRACSPNETSMRDRQPPLERAAIDTALEGYRFPNHPIIPRRPAVFDDSELLVAKHEAEVQQLRALVREAFNAGYHCRWTCKEQQYVFDPVLAPGDPDGAYWAWWQQTRPGRLNPDTLEFK